MTWLFIEAADVWLFRDGRPFSAGEGHIARSVFPPTPQTLQGALRALILNRSGIGEEDYRRANAKAQAVIQKIGKPPKSGARPDPGGLGDFALAGPFLARWEEVAGKLVAVRYTPMPADVAQVEKGHGSEYFALRPTPDFPFGCDKPSKYWLPLVPWRDVDEASEPNESGWLRETALTIYLQDEPGFDCLSSAELFVPESRFGIGLDYAKKRPTTGMLYQVEFVRPKPQVGLLVRLTGKTQLPDNAGWLTLGGEMRAARYRTVSDASVIADASLAQPTTRLKLVLSTPAFFSDGWQPLDGKWNQLFNGQKIQLVSAALGRPQKIGGWDIATRWHKPMRAFVPAGSVYFFQSNQPINPPQVLTETPPGELPFDKMGFGQVVAGQWKPA